MARRFVLGLGCSTWLAVAAACGGSSDTVPDEDAAGPEVTGEDGGST